LLGVLVGKRRQLAAVVAELRPVLVLPDVVHGLSGWLWCAIYGVVSRKFHIFGSLLLVI
jgi:hypothetical protein